MIPWWSRLLLRRSRRVADTVARLHAAGRIDAPPTLWQVFLGAVYMRYRLLFRSGTVGVDAERPVRDTRRARWLAWRPVRLPFLLWERAIAPFDLTGFGRDPEFLVRHVLGAHHAADDAVYDLALLSVHPGGLERLRDALAEVVRGESPRGRWLADLVVYEGYHEDLVPLVARALAGDFTPRRGGGIPSDTSVRGFARWCCAQPATPSDTWRALLRGELSFRPASPPPDDVLDRAPHDGGAVR